MVRVEWGFQGRAKWCSYKRTTLIICFVNIAVALYVLHSLYDSLYIYSPKDLSGAAKYTQDQLRKIEESIQVRRAAEPKKLVKLMKQIKDELGRERIVVELPWHLKQKVADEILQKLKNMDANATASMQKDVVEQWRKEKLEELKLSALGKIQNTTFQLEEAGLIIRALKSNWAMLLEEIGLWIPAEVINKEPDEKPDNEEEFETIPGRPLPPECKTELHTDYGGDAVRWGPTNPKDSAADCCQACLDQAKNAKPGEKKCNIWVYCPSENGCHSPDIYQHKHQECWLKYSQKPMTTFKDRYSESYRSSHPSAPLIVPWVSGVISAG